MKTLLGTLILLASTSAQAKSGDFQVCDDVIKYYKPQIESAFSADKARGIDKIANANSSNLLVGTMFSKMDAYQCPQKYYTKAQTETKAIAKKYYPNEVK